MGFAIRQLFLTICLFAVINVNIDAYFTEYDLFVLSKNIDYRNAVDLCSRNGMNLVKIEDEQTNKMVSNFAVKGNLGQYWIDGNRAPGGVRWVYNDGNRMTYNKWQPGQPDGVGNENCINGNFYKNGFWNDASCNLWITAICYFEQDLGNTVTMNEGRLVALGLKASFYRAFNLCEQHGMNIVKIQNEESNQAVYDFASQNNLGEYWIDANDNRVEGLWVYNNGNRIVYSKWYSGQPGGFTNENCVHGNFYKNGFWNDVNCYRDMSVICYFEKSNADIESQLVALGQKSDYYTATNLCQQNGMSLIKIQNEDTNKAVYNYAVQKGLGQYWVDASDFRSEGSWLYNDGSPIIYNKWQPGVPNGGFAENCVQGLYYLNGFWDDIHCFSINSVICYDEQLNPVTSTIEENQLMVLPQKVNYNTAIDLCERRGLGLVKIPNEASNQVVFNYATLRELGDYWIDASDMTTEGLWAYSTGDRIVYNKWYSGEPNGSGNENCVQVSFNKKGYWVDTPCTKKISVICSPKIKMRI